MEKKHRVEYDIWVFFGYERLLYLSHRKKFLYELYYKHSKEITNKINCHTRRMS